MEMMMRTTRMLKRAAVGGGEVGLMSNEQSCMH